MLRYPQRASNQIPMESETAVSSIYKQNPLKMAEAMEAIIVMLNLIQQFLKKNSRCLKQLISTNKNERKKNNQTICHPELVSGSHQSNKTKPIPSLQETKQSQKKHTNHVSSSKMRQAFCIENQQNINKCHSEHSEGISNRKQNQAVTSAQVSLITNKAIKNIPRTIYKNKAFLKNHI